MRKQETFRVYGAVTGTIGGRPVPGVRVAAFDRDFFRDQPLGEDETDATGGYEIRFTRDDFTGPLLRLERSPDLFLRISDAEGELLSTTACRVVANAGADTRIDVAVPWSAQGPTKGDVDLIAGLAVDRRSVAKLSNEQLITGYRAIMYRDTKIDHTDQLKRAFPDLTPELTLKERSLEDLRTAFVQLLAERGFPKALNDADSDDFPAGTTVKSFYTDNIVVKYTTDTASTHKVDDSLPAADSDATFPGGVVVGQIRSSLTDLHADNTEVAPIYVQKVGLFAEHALTSFINPPFSYRDPRNGAARLEFRILNLGGGFGYTSADIDFVVVKPGNDDERNSFTVPHEMMHQVQYRYNGTTTRTGTYGIVREGGARFSVESINDVPNRYVWHGGGKTIWQKPFESLTDDPYASSTPLNYQGGLLWKYMAEHHSPHTQAANEPAVGVAVYRHIVEQSATVDPADPGLGYTMAALRNARHQLPWYGHFDQFHYTDSTKTELSAHETTYGNFLIANYLHGATAPTDPDHDSRFEYIEDADPVTYSAWVNAGVTALENLKTEIPTADDLLLGQGESIVRAATGHHPWAARYYRVKGKTGSLLRMLRVNVETSAGMDDPLIQILRLGPSEELVDIHRSDRTSYSKTVNFDGLESLVIIVASRDNGGDFSVQFDEVAQATDVMITRWHTKVGTEYEVNPKGWAWHWVSPDVMVDNDSDGLADTEVFFDQNNKLKARIRNRGNEDAGNIRLEFYYQKAAAGLSSTTWMPVRNAAGEEQVIENESLDAGLEKWLTVDWAPENDGTDYHHWCVKVVVEVPGDPNIDNKLTLSNFGNVVVAPSPDPDRDFSLMIRLGAGTRLYKEHILPRGPSRTFELFPPAGLPDAVGPVGPVAPRLGQKCLMTWTPERAGLSAVRVREKRLEQWDGKRRTVDPLPDTYYPVDPETLPPGVQTKDLVTVAHVEDGQVIGGVTYTVSRKG